MVLAGRRVDADGAEEPRFPLGNAASVQAQIREILASQDARILVCSAACGADLLALEAAGQLELRRRVILPFERLQFRKLSVVDRPGDWGPRFDRVMDEVEASGDVVVMEYSSDDPDVYLTTSRVLFDEGIRIARENDLGLLVVVVWNGVSRGESDATDAFLRQAKALGLPAAEVNTL